MSKCVTSRPGRLHGPVGTGYPWDASVVYGRRQVWFPQSLVMDGIVGMHTVSIGWVKVLANTSNTKTLPKTKKNISILPINITRYISKANIIFLNHEMTEIEALGWAKSQEMDDNKKNNTSLSHTMADQVELEQIMNELWSGRERRGLYERIITPGW